MAVTIFLVSCLVLAWPVASVVPRPRGVAISMAHLYPASETFQCIDGSKDVPFDHVNDDYCDCPDGSDEPGTAACSNGKFHCTNAGHLPLNIPSSRVNDGICDCCDGSDEWSGIIACVNNCKELGKKLREERDRVKLQQEEGYKTRLSFSEEGKKKREEKRAELERLEKEKVEMEALKMEMEEKKTEAELPETEAKEKHEKAWEEVKEQREKEKDKTRALIAFDDLDSDDDARVSAKELMSRAEFDIDSNGEVSEEEAKEHLETESEADFDHFMEKVWPNIKQFYKPAEVEEEAKGDNQENTSQDGPPSTTPVPIPSPPGDDDEDDDEYRDEYDDEEDEEFDEDHYHETDESDTSVKASLEETTTTQIYPDDIHEDQSPKVATEESETKQEEDNEEKMPEYDEETQKLIQAADDARNQFKEAERKLRDTEAQINQINSYLNVDYGPEEEYSALKGNCYEYTDREYTYKLCPFERASQRPKNGGAETTLGNWGHWAGPDTDKYSAMMYEKGQNCWNGPDRSVKVNIRCGLENEVTSAFEPSRCEYQFDFSTPCRCQKPAEEPFDIHDEL